MGFRYRVDHPIRAEGRRPIRPDLVFTRARIVVFVQGCFWHACPAHGTRPKTNSDYWSAKLDANVARDRRNDDVLTAEGWTVVRVWEHEDPDDAARRVATTVRALRRR